MKSLHDVQSEASDVVDRLVAVGRDAAEADHGIYEVRDRGVLCARC